LIEKETGSTWTPFESSLDDAQVSGLDQSFQVLRDLQRLPDTGLAHTLSERPGAWFSAPEASTARIFAVGVEAPFAQAGAEFDLDARVAEAAPDATIRRQFVRHIPVWVKYFRDRLEVAFTT